MSENPIFSYTNRSLESAREEGIRRIPILSRGTWTDMSPTDPGMIILDYVHALVDMVQFYQDHQALESFITTAKERENIFRLAKQLSYNIRSAKGSTVDVKFYLDAIYDTPIKIPKYTTVYTESGINFLTTKDVYIPAGQNNILVTCTQGELVIESYTGTGISSYSAIEGATNQVYILRGENVDIDSITIQDNVGRYWEPVEYIIFSEPNSRVYQKDLNADGSISIKFGDGERGIIPQESDTLSIEYINTLAEAGRVGAETINRIRDTIFDSKGNPVKIFVTNPSTSIGGSGPQSDEDIVARVPGAIKSQDRAVTLSDFENLARMVDGVADAKAYDINTAPPNTCLHHEVKVVIIPDNYEVANHTLLDNVYNYLSKRMIPPTNLVVISPSEVPIDIDVSIVPQTTENLPELEYNIQQVIIGYFRERHSSLGTSFIPQELSSRISNVPGVRYVSSISPTHAVDVSVLSTIKLESLKIHIIKYE